MKREPFSQEQIIGVLKKSEAGAGVTYLCRRHELPSTVYYTEKAALGYPEKSDASGCERNRASEQQQRSVSGCRLMKGGGTSATIKV